MSKIEDPSGDEAETSPTAGVAGQASGAAARAEPTPCPDTPSGRPAPDPDAAEPEAPDALAPDALVDGALDDTGALADEAQVVEEAAGRPADGGASRRNDVENSFLFSALTLAVLLFFGWIAGTTLWDLRQEVGALRDRVQRMETVERSARAARNRAALARARAELEGLEATLAPDLAREVTGVRRSLERLSGRLPGR